MNSKIKRNSRFFIISIIVAVVGMLIIFYLKNRPTISIAQPVPSSDATSNWKTYSDQKYKFTFSYPNDWQVGNSKPGSSAVRGLGTTKLEILIAPKMIYDNGGYIGRIYVSTLSAANIIEDAKKSNVDHSQYLVETGRKSIKFVSQKDIMFSETKATKLIFEDNGSFQNTIVFSIQNLTYSIYYLSTGEENSKIFDQILSTFKFIE